MKKFLIRAFLFFIAIALIILLSVFFIPNLVITDSLYYSILDKHKLLEENHSPRLIFLGGSNLSFGLDSRTIEDSLGIRVINMGIQAGLGLKYICSDILPYIEKGDIVVISPEFAHLIKNDENAFLGTDKLLYILFDIYPEGRKNVHGFTHWSHIISLLPKYAADKIFYLPKGLKNKYTGNSESDPLGIYSRDSFNEHGDVNKHWYVKNMQVDPYTLKGKVNFKTIDFLNRFEIELNNRGAKAYYMSTCYQKSAFEKNRKMIVSIDDALKKNLKMREIQSYNRYIFNDSLFFNTVYHLNKQGVDLRSMYIIEDLKFIKNSGNIKDVAFTRLENQLQ